MLLHNAQYIVNCVCVQGGAEYLAEQNVWHATKGTTAETSSIYAKAECSNIYPMKCRKICEQCLITLRNVLNCCFVPNTLTDKPNEKGTHPRSTHTLHERINSPEAFEQCEMVFVTSRRLSTMHVMSADAAGTAKIDIYHAQAHVRPTKKRII